MRLSADDARKLGASLRRVKPELIKPFPGGERLWWVGGEKYFEASAHLDREGALVFFEVSVRGREVRLERGLKTADTGEMRVDEGMPASKLVTDDRDTDEALVESVIVVLRAARDEVLERVAGELVEALALRRGV